MSETKIQMKDYLSKQQVKATPMTRAEYNKLRDWPRLAGERDEDEGYLVQIPGKPNLIGFDGYVTWVLKDIFEKSHCVYASFIDRLHVEYAELNDKVVKLEGFIGSNHFTLLESLQQELLLAQFSAMGTYLTLLGSRLKLLN
jgi:hypothetical protein